MTRNLIPFVGCREAGPRPARKTGWLSRSGQATVEYAVTYAGIVLPLTLGVVFAAELLWVWHSVVDFTREGARYAATHCWTANGDNVTTYMRTHVPRMIDMDQFTQGNAQISVRYFSRDPDTGSLVDFSCATGECSVDCLPDAVSVSVSNYQFRRFGNLLALPPVDIPDFRTSLPMESAGCDPEQATCLP